MTSITIGSAVMTGRAMTGRAMTGRATARAPRLRLTRRGRVVFSLLAVGPVLAAALLLGWGDQGAVAGSEAPGASFEYVTVAPGESLWQLAVELAPGADPRDVIAELVALNQLPSAAVDAGQRLAVPADYRP